MVKHGAAFAGLFTGLVYYETISHTECNDSQLQSTVLARGKHNNGIFLPSERIHSHRQNKQMWRPTHEAGVFRR